MRNTGPRIPEVTMNRHGSLAVGAVFVLGLLLLWGSSLALAGEASPPEPSSPEWKKNLPFELTGEVEGGIQVVQPRGNASSSSTGESSTFDEYRDLPRTDNDGWGHLFQVPSFRLKGEDRAHTRYLEMGGTDLTRMDANYYMNAGVYNYLRFNFEFDRLPHNISNTAQTIFTEGAPGIFTIQGGAGLAAALNGVASNPATQAQRNAVIAAVNPLLSSTELGFQTDNARMGLSWLPLPELELSAGYTRTMRDGHVPWGVLIGSPGSNVVELAGTRDETFHEVKAGAEYVQDWYQLRFNYTFSLFENNVDRLEWANPCGAAAAGGCTNPSGLGRYSTMPDNFAHTFSGGAAVNLPWWRSRLTGGFSYAMWRQNETFLPWTTVAGFTGNTADSGANSPNAKMNIVNGSLNLTTRPLRDVSTTTRYRYYELENDLPDLVFTNVLSPGDTRPAAVGNTHETEAISFRRQNASQDIAWRIIPMVTVKGLYEWDHWNRFEREAESTNEHTFGGTVDVRPLSWMLARFKYTHSVKTIHAGGYEPLGGNAISLPQFRKFDEADRTRDKGDILLQVTPIETVTVSGSFYGQDDDYFNSPYGLLKAQSWGYSADVQWAPIERLNLFVGYAYDEYNSHERSCNVPGAPPTPCNPTGVDDFFVRPRDTLYTVRTGANIAIIPKRLDLSLSYTYSHGDSKQGTAGVLGGIASGDPTDVPTTKNALQIFNVVGSYYLTPQWTLKLGYQYERYSETDFTTDGIAPPLAALPVSPLAQADARSIVLGAQHPPYEVHIVAFTLTYKF
jgi:MtrB/PioB family decaheme-associated outer membrane protein